ncbi:ERF family protein [Ensifer adhaerens]|uniref:ERF family protein n=1 Tax=Ensifer adhaerens TaxID=106592 RepID=UPI000DC5A80E|nr:ERF family protein [Ensifer adhaerens]RAS13511.1 ERF superfamily protein [Ensifer adhaerens]
MAALIKHEPANVSVPVSNAMTPMDMLDKAVAQGANIDVLERLMSLQERWEKNNSRRAFDEAMAFAKAEIPVIAKSKKVDFTTQKGRTNYQYEDLAIIARTIDPILTKYGLSYRFRTETTAGTVTVTCIVSHREGHSEENSLSGAHDMSGNKNSIQAVGSTITYLQRYTLKAALGLAASNDDDGGKSEQTADDVKTITEAQASVIRDLIDESGADTVKFCEFWKVEAVTEIPMKKFNDAVASLRRRIAATKQKDANNG